MPADEPNESEVEIGGKKYKCVFDSFTIEESDTTAFTEKNLKLAVGQISGVLTFDCKPPSPYLMRLHNPPRN